MTALLNKKVFELNAIHLLDDRRMVHIVNMSGGGGGSCIVRGREGCGWGWIGPCLVRGSLY